MVEAIHYNKNDNETDRSSSSQTLSNLYPDRRTLPTPPALREPIPSVTLSELESGKYTSTTARSNYPSLYTIVANANDFIRKKLIASN